jgi:hypothetical protein
MNAPSMTIDQVNACLELFKQSTSCVSFVNTLIHDNTDEIIQNGYAILKPMLTKKYPKDENYCWITTLPPNPNLATDVLQFSNKYAFLEGRRIVNLGDIGLYKAKYKNIQLYLRNHANYYYRKLRENNYAPMFYDLTILDFNEGPQLQINLFMKDVSSPYHIVVGSPIELSSIIHPIPRPFFIFVERLSATLKYVGPHQDRFQYGPDFSDLICVSSTNPKWEGQPISNCFGDDNQNIPLLYETIIGDMNTYPTLLEGQKCFVTYQFQQESWVAVIEILPDSQFVQTSLRLSDIFKPVNRQNDEVVTGSLKVRNKDTVVMNVDTSTNVTCFNEKVGINQSPFEVNAILDIDTNTQQQIITINSTIKTSLSTLYEVVNKNIDTVHDFIMADTFSAITIFTAPIQPRIVSSDIKLINGTLNIDDDSLQKIGDILHEVSYVAQSNQTYTFVETFKSDNVYYLTVMVGIIQQNKMVFFAIPTNIDFIMKDASLSKRFTNVISKYSKLNRSLNYAVTLLENSTIQNDLLEGKSESFTSAIDAVTDYVNIIERAGYFFCFSYDDDINISTYLFHEANKQWANERISALYIGDIKVLDVLNAMKNQYTNTYDSQMMQTCIIDYMWTNGLKVSFVHKIVISGKTYMICVGMNLMESLIPSIHCRGDSTLSGNFTITDDSNVVFHIDNYEKCVKSMYKMGIGTPFPKSSLDIQDSGIDDIIYLINDVSKYDKYTNHLLSRLRDIDMTILNIQTLFDSLNTVSGFEEFTQTIDNYYMVLDLTTETFLYRWLYSEFVGTPISQLKSEFPDSAFLIDILTVGTQQLKSSCHFDGSLFHLSHMWTFGEKKTEAFFFETNGVMYVLCIGKNVQRYNLRINTNTNQETFFSKLNAYGYYLQDILIETLSPTVINPSVLTDNIIKEQRTYPMTSYTVYDIEDSSVETRDFTTHALISSEHLSSMEYNRQTKFLSFVDYYTKYYNLFENGYGMLRFEDSVINYVSQFYLHDGKIYSVEYTIDDIITPTLTVQGDAQIQGNLVVHNKYTDLQYVTIDPGSKFVGINTDERTILYEADYTTTDTIEKLALHHVYVKNDKYPNMVCERQNDAEDSFTNFSASTVKRNSNFFTFQEMLDGSKTDTSYGAPDQSMYGVDISFEISDKTNTTQEIGNVIMGIESIDQTGHIQAGFGVDVYDPNLQPRRILSVSNSGCLTVNSLKLGDHDLKIDETGLLKMPPANCLITTIHNRQTLETHYPFALMNSTDTSVEHTYKILLPSIPEPVIVYSLIFQMEYTEYMLHESDDISNPASYFFKSSFTYDTTWITTDKKIPNMPNTPKRYPCEETEYTPQISFKFEYVHNSIHFVVIMPSNTYIVSNLGILLGQIYPIHKTLYDNYNFNIEKI